jgi:hypothetical protein
MKKILLSIAIAYSFALHSHADVINQSNSYSVGTAGSSFQFNMFNQALGSLTGVTLTIKSSTDFGSALVALTNSSFDVSSFIDRLQVTDNQYTGLNFNGSQVNITTTPSTPFTIPANTSQTFTFSLTSLLPGGNPFSQNLAPQYLSSYQSGNGSGIVSFSATISPDFTSSGSFSDISDFNTANWLNTTELQLTYTYTAVPEPSTYALFGLGAIGMLMVMRRKKTA